MITTDILFIDVILHDKEIKGKIINICTNIFFIKFSFRSLGDSSVDKELAILA